MYECTPFGNVSLWYRGSGGPCGVIPKLTLHCCLAEPHKPSGSTSIHYTILFFSVLMTDMAKFILFPDVSLFEGLDIEAMELSLIISFHAIWSNQQSYSIEFLWKKERPENVKIHFCFIVKGSIHVCFHKLPAYFPWSQGTHFMIEHASEEPRYC